MNNGFDLAKNRGAKNVLALAYAGVLYDLSSDLSGLVGDVQNNAEIDKIEFIHRDDPRALDLLRHSSAHLLAHAVKELYPTVQVTIGPAIENGFYYDFSATPFTPEDLIAIEKRMNEIVKRNIKIVRQEMPRDDAVKYFLDLGEKYKAEIIKDLPEGEKITLYQQDNFVDLCRGPHVPSTAALKVFKLTKLAGAYWRGDSKNEMLQRIYGTAWSTKDELAQYLFMIEEAEKRDHRKLGTQLDLYHIREESPGMVFWHRNGWTIWQQVEQYMRKKLTINGYQEVRTPQVVDRQLWEKSGHWENFHKNMYTTEAEERQFAIKPMNCPCHIMIYNQGIKSYRDLPLRLAEFGSCHRYEPSGALHGLMRVRGFTQDDAHLFVTSEQIMEESRIFIDLLLQVYKDFGFEDVIFKLSLRPEQRLGDDSTWDRAEKALEDALKAHNIKYEVQLGEGAFYGPKIEFSLKDSLGRVWQCGTLQVDFFMPERLGARYITADNKEEAPVMLHRAILGSLERFIGILIEHYAGALPIWLAPTQVVLLNISEAQAEYTKELTQKLCEMGVRASCDLSNEKITYKIREHGLQKIPYLAVIGNREMENGEVAIRPRGTAEQMVMAWQTLAENILAEEKNRTEFKIHKHN